MRIVVAARGIRRRRLRGRGLLAAQELLTEKGPADVGQARDDVGIAVESGTQRRLVQDLALHQRFQELREVPAHHELLVRAQRVERAMEVASGDDGVVHAREHARVEVRRMLERLLVAVGVRTGGDEKQECREDETAGHHEATSCTSRARGPRRRRSSSMAP